MLHQNFSDGHRLYQHDLIYEDLLNLCHHVADENHSTHDEEHGHHERVFLVSTHVLVHDHHELVVLESTLCEVLCHHELVSQESTHVLVHDHHVQDALVSTLYEVLCHHELVFQESTLCEVILSLILHEKRCLLYERYGQQMILLNQLESIQDESQHFVLDDRYAVHGLDESL